MEGQEDLDDVEEVVRAPSVAGWHVLASIVRHLQSEMTPPLHDSPLACKITSLAASGQQQENLTDYKQKKHAQASSGSRSIYKTRALAIKRSYPPPNKSDDPSCSLTYPGAIASKSEQFC